MFRRAFWFTTGVAAGVWATNKVNRKLRALAPESLAAQAADKAVETGHRLRRFALDVRAGMADREEQLHEALGLTPPSEARELPVPRARAVLEPDHRTTKIHKTFKPPETTGKTGKEDH